MKNKYFLLPLIVSFAVLTLMQSCGPKKGSITAAREAFLKKEYFISGTNYRKVYSSTKNKQEKIESANKAAECYWLMNDMKNAESWYRKAIKVDPSNSENQLRLAKSLKNNQKFEEAIVEFKNYQKLTQENAAAVERQIKGCENALKWKNDKTRYNVENVKGLNTRWQDFAPQWFKKDQLYFTSDREKGVSGSTVYGWTGNGYTDLYTATYKVDKKNPNNITYQAPVLVDKDKINGKLNDGSIAFDSRFSTAYVTRCNYDNNGKGKSCRIYQSTLTGSEWSAPEPLEFSSDSFNCGHPSLTKDNQLMYFSSDMPGGFGGKDIYVVSYSKRSKTWGDPVNLGPVINTEDDEMYPTIHEDGTLYFASNGHVGLGGTDIFMTKGSGTDWGEPINMKSPINSHGDDFAIIFGKDKESGYFSSNRDGGKGQDDIYRFSMNPLVFTLSGVVRNAKTKAVMPNALVTITSSSDTGKIVLKTDQVGSYKIVLKQKTDYELFASRSMFYDSKLEEQTTKGLEQSTDLVQDFELNSLGLETFTLRGILYDLDRAEIRPDAALILDSLVLVLNKYPSLKIELGSHTDCRADSLYNINLSQRRADSAVAYLVSRGIDSLRLESKGYGENDLEVKECACEGPNERAQGLKCTEAQHQLNRRTTVKVLDIYWEKPKPVVAEPPKTPAKPGAKPAPRRAVTAPPR
ncbi:MAG: OmpA family protein [Bacteroidia bacterium]|nr:OmpA family protein [Bacteroidia bacterium]